MMMTRTATMQEYQELPEIPRLLSTDGSGHGDYYSIITDDHGKDNGDDDVDKDGNYAGIPGIAGNSEVTVKEKLRSSRLYADYYSILTNDDGKDNGNDDDDKDGNHAGIPRIAGNSEVTVKVKWRNAASGGERHG